MRITLDLTTDEALALRRFANTHHPLPLEEAAALALQTHLNSIRDIEPVPSID